MSIRYNYILVLCVLATSAFAVDTTPPTVSVIAPSNNQAFNTPCITVSGTAADASGIRNVKVKVNSGYWRTASGTTSWSKAVTLNLGANTIYIRATDNSYRANTTTVSISPVYYDTTPPDVSIPLPSDAGMLTSKTFTLSGTASDNVELSKVEVKVGSGNWEMATGTTAWSKSVTLTAGNNAITARATDTAGNIQTSTATLPLLAVLI